MTAPLDELPSADVVRPPGVPTPLGATIVPGGVNLAVWSPSATLIEACLFDEAGNETRIPMESRSDSVHHAMLPGIGAGALYGLRAHGPWDPSLGQRFNPHKLLIDPYARAVHGEVWLNPAITGAIAGDLGHRNDLDSAAYVPRSVVVDDAFDWQGDVRPMTSWDRTVIYEMHVKGFTATHPDIPEHLRGTYAGLAHPAAIDYLKALGITAIEILPVHQFASEPALIRRGSSNYWGYNTLAFFAPHAAYSSAGSQGQQVAEFKEMVRCLHAAGIEVILDVVYNHTCEAGIDGPTLSLRGLGDAEHYKLIDGGSRYLDTTGCGNTVDAGDLGVVRLITDSLRYWVEEMHVDGFRFDLAPTLTRVNLDCDNRAPFLAAVHQDPLLRNVKLIAEPWDVGWGGYRLGEFGSPWAEWNDRYRGDIREFWRGSAGGRDAPADMGWRLTGSQDSFWGRSPCASINFITAHDGFTMADLTAYNRKHNEDNGEDNRDGTEDNRSWNHGVEGPTEDESILAARRRTIRGLMATLLLSTGTPMLTMGDEVGRTQGGNNNAYCRDDEVSWMPWSLDPWQSELQEWTKALIAVRHSHPTLRQGLFFDGRPVAKDRPADLSWLTPGGEPMPDEAWHDPGTRTLVMAMSGELFVRDETGHPMHDAAFLVVLNTADEDVELTLPLSPYGNTYERILDTADERPATNPSTHPGGTTTTVTSRTVTLFRLTA